MPTLVTCCIKTIVKHSYENGMIQQVWVYAYRCPWKTETTACSTREQSCLFTSGQIFRRQSREPAILLFQLQCNREKNWAHLIGGLGPKETQWVACGGKYRLKWPFAKSGSRNSNMRVRRLELLIWWMLWRYVEMKKQTWTSGWRLCGKSWKRSNCIKFSEVQLIYSIPQNSGTNSGLPVWYGLHIKSISFGPLYIHFSSITAKLHPEFPSEGKLVATYVINAINH